MAKLKVKPSETIRADEPVAAATVNPSPNPLKLEPLPEDPGKEIMKLLVQVTLAKLKEGDATPSFLEFSRKLMQDNAVTLGSIRKGNFGEVYQAAAEDFPFPDDTRVSN